MRKNTLSCCALTAAGFVSIVLFPVHLNAQAAGKAKTPAQPAQQRRSESAAQGSSELETDMKAATPGPAHQFLLKRVGEYTTATKLTVAPGAAPVESTGTAKISSALDGRFIIEENNGSLFGIPTRGLNFYGYSNGSKKYEAIWTYTMSTAIMTLAGTSTDGGKTVNYTATYDDAAGARQTLYVMTKQLDDDRFVVELSAKKPDGTQGPTIQTTYLRKK